MKATKKFTIFAGVNGQARVRFITPKPIAIWEFD